MHCQYAAPEESSVSMDPNDAEVATNSSIEASEFSCRELYAEFVTEENVSDTIALWITIGLVCLASPTIVLLNALVIIAMRLCKELQRLSYVLLLSMAISDLLVGAVCMPLTAIVDSFIARKTLSENVCVLEFVTVYLMYILCLSSVLHLTLIAWERYVAIQKCMEYKIIVTKSRLNKLAIIAWVSATLLVLPEISIVVLSITVASEDYVLYFAEAMVFVSSILAVCALALIVYFYVKVYLGVRKRKLSEISKVTSLISAKLEKKVAKMMALVTAVLIISFIPFFVSIGLSGVFPVFLKRWALRLPEILMQFSSIANPLIYCYGDRRFKRAVLELLRVRKSGTNQPAAVAGVRFVSRKGRFGSVENVLELQERVNLIHLTRRSSCDQALVSDCTQVKSCNAGFKRSISAPSLPELSPAAAGNVSKPSCSRTVEFTAVIHSEREGGKKTSKRNPEKIPKAAKRSAVEKEKQGVPLTDLKQDTDVLQKEREK